MSNTLKSPQAKRRPDTTKNPAGVDEAIASQKEREKKLFLMKVSNTTWILVPKEKHNRAYAEQYRKDKIDFK